MNRKGIASAVLLVIMLAGSRCADRPRDLSYWESDWVNLGRGIEVKARVALTPTPTPTPTLTPTPMPTPGNIIRVTTLKDGWGIAGSLREAIYADVGGPRTIVFDVGGTINLVGNLSIAQPSITIAGETAPSPGITLVGGELRIYSHDIEVRHLRIRTGANPNGKSNPIRILGTAPGGPRREVYNVVIDHCSISQGDDEMIQIYWPDVHDVAISNCLITEGAHDPNNGDYSMALNVGDGVQNVTISSNLFVGIWRRSPRLGGGSSGVVANNVVYDWWSTATHVDNGGGHTKASIVGNVYIRGPGTPARGACCILLSNEDAEVYLSDNAGEPPLVKGEVSTIVDKPPMPLGEVMPSGMVLEHVLSNAGARPWDRDEVDDRAVSLVRGAAHE
jgi:pectate lyase